MWGRSGVIDYPGVYDNILKIRPPLIFTNQNADLLLDKLEGVLAEKAGNP